MRKNIISNRNKCVFLTKHRTILANECQTIHIGIHNDAEVETTFTYTSHDTLQVLLQRFGIMSEISIGLSIQYLIVNTQSLEKIWKDNAPHTIDGINANAKASLANSLVVNEFQGEHTLDVTLVESIVFNIFTQMVHIGIFKFLCLCNTEHLVSIFLIEELTLVVEQF